MRFEFATAGRIIFGPGSVREVGEIAAAVGHRPLLVTGRSPERAQPLLDSLGHHDLKPAAFFVVAKEPDLDTVRTGTALAREEHCDLVIGVGGGAVIDTAKAVAALATNPGDLLDYLEIIGRGRGLSTPPLPVIAIPTTAGTGSEVTRNSVITSPTHRLKVSLRSPLLLPRVAVIDPELTYDLPPLLTATTGLDALAQVLEPFVCIRANPLTDGLCREALSRAAQALRRAVKNGRDAAAREDMALVSLFGGLALANAGLGAVHGLAGPLGGLVEAPHGALCAALLPAVVAGNIRALRQRSPHDKALSRYEEAARLLTGRPTAQPEDTATWLRQLTTDLEIPPLRAHGLEAQHIPDLIDKALGASSMKANPVVLTREELAAIVEAAW